MRTVWCVGTAFASWHLGRHLQDTEPDRMEEEAPGVRPKLTSAPGWDAHSTKPACLLASEYAVAALWSLLKDEVCPVQHWDDVHVTVRYFFLIVLLGGILIYSSH